MVACDVRITRLKRLPRRRPDCDRSPMERTRESKRNYQSPFSQSADRLPGAMPFCRYRMMSRTRASTPSSDIISITKWIPPPHLLHSVRDFSATIPRRQKLPADNSLRVVIPRPAQRLSVSTATTRENSQSTDDARSAQPCECRYPRTCRTGLRHAAPLRPAEPERRTCADICQHAQHAFRHEREQRHRQQPADGSRPAKTAK